MYKVLGDMSLIRCCYRFLGTGMALRSSGSGFAPSRWAAEYRRIYHTSCEAEYNIVIDQQLDRLQYVILEDQVACELQTIVVSL